MNTYILKFKILWENEKLCIVSNLSSAANSFQVFCISQMEKSAEPFPTYNYSAADHFENIPEKNGNSLLMKVQYFNRVENMEWVTL